MNVCTLVCAVPALTVGLPALTAARRPRRTRPRPAGARAARSTRPRCRGPGAPGSGRPQSPAAHCSSSKQRQVRHRLQANAQAHARRRAPPRAPAGVRDDAARLLDDDDARRMVPDLLLVARLGELHEHVRVAARHRAVLDHGVDAQRLGGHAQRGGHRRREALAGVGLEHGLRHARARRLRLRRHAHAARRHRHGDIRGHRPGAGAALRRKQHAAVPGAGACGTRQHLGHQARREAVGQRVWRLQHVAARGHVGAAQRAHHQLAVLQQRQRDCVLVAAHKAERAIHRVQHPVPPRAAAGRRAAVDGGQDLVCRQRPRAARGERLVDSLLHAREHGGARRPVAQRRAVLLRHQRHAVAKRAGQHPAAGRRWDISTGAGTPWSCAARTRQEMSACVA
jgi:hypothetical protein